MPSGHLGEAQSDPQLSTEASGRTTVKPVTTEVAGQCLLDLRMEVTHGTCVYAKRNNFQYNGTPEMLTLRRVPLHLCIAKSFAT